MLFAKLHLLHASHLQVNLDVCGATLFFLDVHDVFDNWFDSFFNNN